MEEVLKTISQTNKELMESLKAKDAAMNTLIARVEAQINHYEKVNEKGGQLEASANVSINKFEQNSYHNRENSNKKQYDSRHQHDSRQSDRQAYGNSGTASSTNGPGFKVHQQTRPPQHNPDHQSHVESRGKSEHGYQKQNTNQDNKIRKRSYCSYCKKKIS